ncbi:hypothetical protein [Acetobacter persici]|uniref:hypothetical protein n=1 Tax=Acetobacter persici TaxID=1076596 RepID=UPI0039EBD96D
MALSPAQNSESRQGLLFTCLAFIGVVLNLRATLPGYLYSDSKLILEEIQTHRYSDWHSPFYRWFWGLWTRILPGPEGITVFNIGGLWLACLAIALLLRRKLGWKAGFFLLVPILPGQLNLTGTVVLDTTMNVFFLAAFVCSLLAAGATRERLKLRYVVASTLCLTATVLTRSNSLFAILPLLAVNTGLIIPPASPSTSPLAPSNRKRLFTFAASLCGVLLAGPLLNVILKPSHNHPIISLQVKHLQQLSYYTQQNRFPGTWTTEQTHQILHSCEKDRAWDNDSFWGHCSFIARAANQDDASRRATGHAWLKTLVTHPFGFFVSSLPTYKVALFDPTRPIMLFNWGMPDVKIPWQDQEPWDKSLHERHKTFIESGFNLEFGKPFMGILLSCLGLVVCFVTRSRLDQYDRVFCALMASGIIYLLTFLPINVATEYRYYIWGLLSAEVGAVYCVASLSRSLRFNFSKTAFPPLIKGLVAVSTALVLTTKLFSYPQEVRTFSITPQGDAPARILYLREEIDKFWTDAFEGHVDAPGWNLSNNEYVSGKNSQPLTMTLSLPYQDAALGYATGPDYGSFRVCEGAGKTCQTVDARSATAGEQTLILPGGTPPIGTVFTVKWVSLFLGLSLALYLVLLPGLLRAGRALVRNQRPQAS